MASTLCLPPPLRAQLEASSRAGYPREVCGLFLGRGGEAVEGSMKELLAEAGVPYDKIFDLEEINGEFAQADVALIIGANDVVNPVARTDKGSPIYGMPILNADLAHNCIVIKRGKGSGYSGIENALFYKDNTRMLYGSAQAAVAQIIQQVKAMSA